MTHPLVSQIQDIRRPIGVVRTPAGAFEVAQPGQTPNAGLFPPIFPEWLGDRSFCEVHRLRFPYVAGAMANGIATTDLVIAMAQAGMLGFYGAAGLSFDRVSEAIDRLEAALGTGASWGSNLIHSPNEPALEEAVVKLYLDRGVRRVSASAYMSLSPHVVWYSAKGLRKSALGHIHRDNYVFAKISRPEVAAHFMAPAPKPMLDALVAAGKLTAEEAALALEVPVAEDIIVEADSGGHTDNQALSALFPIIMALRDDRTRQYGFTRPIRVGAAGGLGAPSAVAGAFSMGAAFVLTGSVNQGAVESGLAPDGKVMLAKAGLADVIMAAAADMFELGVKLQVLKRGTMFGVRANRLYDIYAAYPSMDAIPAAERAVLEKQIFKRPLSEVWDETRAFWQRREPRELARAEADPKHQMALCFRWYLGLSSRWAIAGDDSRRMDYQIWCGPAMGAFNDWVRGSFLDPPEARTAVQIALNLLEGAAALTRAQQLRAAGVAVPSAAFRFVPRPIALSSAPGADAESSQAAYKPADSTPAVSTVR